MMPDGASAERTRRSLIAPRRVAYMYVRTYIRVHQACAIDAAAWKARPMGEGGQDTRARVSRK